MNMTTPEGISDAPSADLKGLVPSADYCRFGTGYGHTAGRLSHHRRYTVQGVRACGARGEGKFSLELLCCLCCAVHINKSQANLRAGADADWKRWGGAESQNGLESMHRRIQVVLHRHCY